MKTKIINFFKMALNFFRKFPVLLTTLIVLPSLIYTAMFLYSVEEIYYNLYYEGERIHTDHEHFKLTGIKKVANVVQVAAMFSYQGGACYQNYYAVVTDNFEAVEIYDTNTMKVAHSINTGIVNTDWHCNQMFFGPDYYSARDKFPLLYISMESAKVHSLYAFRIYQVSGVYYIKMIQRVQLYFETEEETIYYPNAYYDYSSNKLYYVGYTKKSYMQEEDNFLRYYSFYLPDYRFEDTCFFLNETIDEPFDLPSETAGQGGFISDGYLYQTFSFASKDDPKRMPKMRIVNLRTHEIVYNNQNLGAEFGIYKEFEHLAISSSGRMFSLGNPFDIYEFEYENSPIIDYIDEGGEE